MYNVKTDERLSLTVNNVEKVFLESIVEGKTINELVDIVKEKLGVSIDRQFILEQVINLCHQLEMAGLIKK